MCRGQLTIQAEIEQQELDRHTLATSTQSGSETHPIATVGSKMPTSQVAASDVAAAKENGTVTAGEIAAFNRQLAMPKAQRAPCNATITQLRTQVHHLSCTS